jgi:hypothetical protein
MCLISGSKAGFPILYVHFSCLATVETGCARALDQDWRRKGTKCHPVRVSLGTWGRENHAMVNNNSPIPSFHGPRTLSGAKKRNEDRSRSEFSFS